MSSTTITDLSEKEWEALKSTSHVQHGTVYSGDNSGTATTNTPGLGRTVVSYNYDSASESAKFTINEKPDAVPDEVIWFALGASIAHASGAPATTLGSGSYAKG